MKQYLLAVGGTGNKILEGVVWAAAAGVLDPGGELRMLSVDVDASCGNTTRAMQSCAHYEAVRELLRYGFEDLGLNTIWCDHYDGNQKSRRVIRKCGFRFRFLRMQEVPDLGETRLALCYSMTRQAWEAAR